MKQFIGNIPGPNGTISFEMDGDNLSATSAAGRQIIIPDCNLKEIEGKIFANVKDLKFGYEFQEIEIPQHILEARDKVRAENKRAEGSIGYTETPKGKVYFSISEDCNIIVKLGEKEAIAATVYSVENTRAIPVPSLNLGVPFLEVPESVEKSLIIARKQRDSKSLHLTYQGRSLLTGLDYYAFSAPIDSRTFERVQDWFEWFEPGNTGIPGELSGWCTSEPGKVEEIMRHIKNKTANREEEIKKQKESLFKDQTKYLKKL